MGSHGASQKKRPITNINNTDYACPDAYLLLYIILFKSNNLSCKLKNQSEIV